MTKMVILLTSTPRGSSNMLLSIINTIFERLRDAEDRIG